jgi:hypothetical protein
MVPRCINLEQHVDAPPVRRHIQHKGVVRGVVLSIVFLIVIIAGITLPARAAERHFEDPPLQVMPGSHLPDGAVCNWTTYSRGDMMYCNIALQNKTLYFSYDLRRKVIVHTSMPVDKQTVGNLIVVWGDPTGIEHYTWSAEVQWGNRSIFVSTHPFNPTSEIYFVSYNLDLTPASPWHGFTENK